MAPPTSDRGRPSPGTASGAERNIREAVVRARQDPGRSPAHGEDDAGDSFVDRARRGARRTAASVADQARDVFETVGEAPRRVAEAAKGQARRVADAAESEAREVTGTVRQQASRVTDTTRDQLRAVAREAAGEGARLGRELDDSLSEVRSGVVDLLRRELELARTELTATAQRAARAGALLGTAGVLGVLGVMLLALAGAWALAVVVPVWAAFLIVGLLVVTVAGGLGLAGRADLTEIDPVPRRTIETLREDQQWLREQIR